jgi:hypothetical protein
MKRATARLRASIEAFLACSDIGGPSAFDERYHGRYVRITQHPAPSKMTATVAPETQRTVGGIRYSVMKVVDLPSLPTA